MFPIRREEAKLYSHCISLVWSVYDLVRPLHLFAIALLHTKFLIKFGFAKRFPRHPFEDFKHFHPLMEPSEILESKLTQEMDSHYLEPRLTLSNLPSSSRFESPSPTREEMGYLPWVRGPRWKIRKIGPKKTPQVKKTLKWNVVVQPKK